jgi:beta-galactosidase
MYRTKLNRDYVNAELSFYDIGDRAQVFVGDKLMGIVYVNDDELKVKISAKAGDILTILVENMGRTNFGPKMMRKKGIIGRCLLDGKIHFGWEAYALPMDNLTALRYGKESGTPAFYRGRFEIEECADTFLSVKNFTKGFAVINGFNLGRFWEVGPQKTLYVPKGILKRGENEILIFESDGLKGIPEIELTDKPDLG